MGVGIVDPNPDISGKCIWTLTENKIMVEHFPHKLQEEIRVRNQEFINKVAKQGKKSQPDGSLKPDEVPKMNQDINVTDSQGITIIQAGKDVSVNPPSSLPKANNWSFANLIVQEFPLSLLIGRRGRQRFLGLIFFIIICVYPVNLRPINLSV